METCSTKSEKLSAFAEMRMLPEEEKTFLEHLLVCQKCQRNLREVYESLLKIGSPPLTSEEKDGLRKIVLKHVKRLDQERNQQRTGWMILENLANVQPLALAAADDQTADQRLLKSALSSNSLTFVAICDKTHPNYWKATFPIPSEPNPEMELSVEVTDVSGEPVVDGTLIFCGIEKQIEEGWCYISMTELRDNLKKQTIAFKTASGELVEGLLELFSDDISDY